MRNERKFVANKVDVVSSELQGISKDRYAICPVCSKSFYMTIVDEWAYKFTNIKSRQRRCCSWKCLNEGKKINKEARYYGKHYDEDIL